jgi:5-methylcytosine-specific restriction enzyme A
MGGRGRRVAWDGWYNTTRWDRIRKHQLRAHPLCKYCLERGRITPAEICDHVEPHKGDINKFWLGPFQSLCRPCHDSTKKFVETRGYRPDIGLDGWPLDPNHPVNRHRALPSIWKHSPAC